MEMEDIKHTSGPWELTNIGEYGDFDGKSRVILGDDMRICAVHASVGSEVDGENEANAHLIATAPELLAALKDLCSFDTELTQAKWDAARSAIAKAEGRFRMTIAQQSAQKALDSLDGFDPPDDHEESIVWLNKSLVETIRACLKHFAQPSGEGLCTFCGHADGSHDLAFPHPSPASPPDAVAPITAPHAVIPRAVETLLMAQTILSDKGFPTCADNCGEVADELRTLPARHDGWRDISSAPKDRTEFIVCFPLQGNVMQLVSWNSIHKYWQSKGDPVGGLAGAVWQHKPAPPYTPAASEESKPVFKTDGEQV